MCAHDTSTIKNNNQRLCETCIITFAIFFTCFYKKIGGFDLNLHGWGLEDVLLYRKYASSASFSINRAPVPTLFHDWHEKQCEMGSNVESSQLRSCVKSKSVNEGSQIQLGELLFMGEDHRRKIGWGSN